jgi:hypothetical protein
MVGNVAGRNVSNPGNSKGADLSVEYRITVDEKKPTNHTMKLNAARGIKGKTDLWGILISNQTPTWDPSKVYDRSVYGNTIAHELGHVLSLLHRDPPMGDPIPDGLNQPKDKNLMGTGGVITPPLGPKMEDLDLIQLIAMRASKAFN